MGFLLSLSDLRQRSQLCSSNSEGTHGWEGMGESNEDNRHSSQSLPTILLVLGQNCHSLSSTLFTLFFFAVVGFFFVSLVFLRLIFRALKGKLLETTCKCFLHY